MSSLNEQDEALYAVVKSMAKVTMGHRITAATLEQKMVDIYQRYESGNEMGSNRSKLLG